MASITNLPHAECLRTVSTGSEACGYKAMAEGDDVLQPPCTRDEGGSRQDASTMPARRKQRTIHRSGHEGSGFLTARRAASHRKPCVIGTISCEARSGLAKAKAVRSIRHRTEGARGFRAATEDHCKHYTTRPERHPPPQHFVCSSLTSSLRVLLLDLAKDFAEAHDPRTQEHMSVVGQTPGQTQTGHV